MKKKILMISGSPRKNGDGAKILKELEVLFIKNNDIECEHLFLKDYVVKICKGCLMCQKKIGYQCPLKDDDVVQIRNKMIEAHGFVFISPVYIQMISAQLKQFIDRNSDLVHRPMIHAGKPAILICTNSYAGAGESLRYLKIPVANMGMYITDKISILSTAYKNKNDYKQKTLKKLSDSSRKFIEILIAPTKPKPRKGEILVFNKWKIKSQFHKEHYPGDYEFWKESGLLDKDYFYETKMNPVLKRVIPFIVKRVFVRISKMIGYM
jgi:multimeric flavodoxin WrbA